MPNLNFSEGNVPVNSLLTRTIRATSDIAEDRGVNFAGAQVSTSGGQVYGFATYAVTSGQDVAVVIAGTCQVQTVTGQSIAAGDPISVDADGRVTKSRATDYIIGRYIGTTAVNQTGRKIEILITREGAAS